ncbi:MAG: aldo/keto reductase [Lachnospiraceae bacterium]|nr:aldo/keto reductase [Lachnospiraceae bacterium]
MKTFKLSNGIELPGIGYGTYLSTEGSKGDEAIRMALEAGYRYLDTASFYKNEEEVGKAVRESGIPREEIMTASKIWKTEMGYENTLKAFENSMERLGFDYLDVYLIHWPYNELSNADWKETIRETWTAMEKLYEEGKVKAIGVSNFLPHHLDVILNDCKIKPMVNQLELHVGYMQTVAVEYSKKHGIVIQAWSPLGRKRIMEEETVVKMAEKYKKSVAEFLLGFLYQQDIMVLPKASNMERIKENLLIDDFTIDDEDMKFLLCLPQIGWSGEHPDF